MHGAAFAPAFTCAAACAATAAAKSPPLALDTAARPWCAAAGGDAAADEAEQSHAPIVTQPQPLAPAAMEALQALWRAVDAAFIVRTQACERCIASALLHCR